MVAAVLGAAVERDRVERGMDALAAFGRFALESDNVSATIEQALDVVRQLVAVPTGALVRLVPDHGTVLRLVQAFGPVGLQPGEEVTVTPSLVDSVLGRDPLIISDRRTDDRFAARPASAAGGWIACLAPSVQIDGRVWGRLVATDVRARAFAASEVELVSSVANLLAAALQRSLHESLGYAPILPAARSGESARQALEVALLDRAGVIIWVNQAWKDFCRDNDGDLDRAGVGISYLDCCEAAADPVADDVAAAIRAAARGELPAPMRILIPCHSPRTDRWYDVLVSSRLNDDGTCLGATITLSLADV